MWSIPQYLFLAVGVCGANEEPSVLQISEYSPHCSAEDDTNKALCNFVIRSDANKFTIVY